MADPVTKLELENASVDAGDLGDILNSDSSTTVTTRLGLPVKSVAKAIGEISAYDDKGAWLTSTGYVIKDLVQESGTTYICTIAHTAGTFATDLAAGKWGIFQTQTPELFLTTYADLPAAIAAIGVNEETLVLDKNETLTAHLAIPANITLRPLIGRTIGGAYTLTHDGAVIAGRFKWLETSVTLEGGANIDKILPEWYGAVGDITTDDSTPGTKALVASAACGAELNLQPGKSYYLKTGMAVDASTYGKSFSIVGYGATVLGPDVAGVDSPAHIIEVENVDGFKADGFSVSYKSVTTRDDDYKSLRITGQNIAVDHVNIGNSMSAGMVINMLNNASDGYYNCKVTHCAVSNTLADGILVTNAGGGVIISDNNLRETADDSISVITFKTAGTYYTKGVTINGNTVYGSDARGIFIGGTLNATITGNTVEYTNNGGINAGYEAAAGGVKQNVNFSIVGNVLTGISTKGTAGAFPHGIVINHLNINGAVSANVITNTKGSGIMCRGNAVISNNHIDITTDDGKGIYLGTEDPLYASYIHQCYGDVKSNLIKSTSSHAVYVARTSTADTYNIQGNTITDCVESANYASDVAPLYQSLGNAEWLGNFIYDQRGSVTMAYAVYVVNGNSNIDENKLYSASGYASGIAFVDFANVTLRSKRATRILSEPTVGDNDVYGTGVDVRPNELQVIKMQASGLGGGETITVKIRALYANGAPETFEHALTDTSGVFATAEQFFSLYTSTEQPLVKYTVYAKSDQVTAVGTVDVFIAGRIS